MKRRGLVAAVGALGVLVLAGCYAQTEPASEVGSTSATLSAHGFTAGKQGQAFFQYSSAKNALGTGFGLQTPTLTFPPDLSGPFTAKVSGLSPGMNYWFRVCGNDVGDQPHCNSDLEFTTVVTGAAVAFGPPLTAPRRGVLATGEFNGDGLPDLVVTAASGSGETDEILLGNGDATFGSSGTVATFGVPVVGDFNRDGKQDLAVATPDALVGSGVDVFPGRGDGTFGAPINTPRNSQLGDRIVVVDFNRDGKPDIAVVGRHQSNDVEVMLGNGNGTFQPADQSFAPGSGNLSTWSDLVVGDFNGDGKPDMALSKETCNVAPSFCGVSVFLGNGNGTFLGCRAHLRSGDRRVLTGGGGLSWGERARSDRPHDKRPRRPTR
jgi:hypothetical protein